MYAENFFAVFAHNYANPYFLGHFKQKLRKFIFLATDVPPWRASVSYIRTRISVTHKFTISDCFSSQPFRHFQILDILMTEVHIPEQKLIRFEAMKSIWITNLYCGMVETRKFCLLEFIISTLLSLFPIPALQAI